ncbi:hypothetical protein [Actinoplanes sp. NPDC049265]|uniref:hypothetical protein n=1 Tax=Actinoplanes sp. NPDC049265 TaxID=3363902 RepID=UPI003714176A
MDFEPSDEVVVDFGAGPRTVPPGLQVLDLTPGGGLAPESGPVDWTQLEQLPRCLTVRWSGPDRGVVEAIRAHMGVRSLHWDDAVGDLGLGDTRLATVRLGGRHLHSARLPEQVETVLLDRPSPGLHLEAPDDGRGLDLRLFHYGPDVVIPIGVRRASEVWIWAGGAFSAARLTMLTDLEDLRLTFDTRPGDLTDLSALEQHASLHTLRLEDAYGLTVDALPNLPGLRRLEITGTRRSIATSLRERFRGGATKLSISGVKTDERLAALFDDQA